MTMLVINENVNSLFSMLTFLGASLVIIPLYFDMKNKDSLLLVFLINLSFLFVILDASLVFIQGGLQDKFILLNIGIASLSLKVNNLGLVFALLISILWPLSSLYSWAYLTANQNSNFSRFFIFKNITLFIAVILSFSANLVTMFICYEALTLVSLPLIAHSYSNLLEPALKKYLYILLGASLCLWLPAILYLSNLSSNLDFEIGGIKLIKELPSQIVIITFILTFFGIAKTTIFPLQGWLPAAMVANYPVSALLHAVAIVKAGVFCLIKISTEIYGQDLLTSSFLFLPYLKYFLISGIIFITLKASSQTIIKNMLAYSTISHLNIIVLSILLFTLTSAKVALIYMIIHSFTKITIFYSFGYLYTLYKVEKISDLSGIVYKEKLIVTAIVVSALILVGFPLFSSGIVKKLILIESLKNSEYIIYGILTILPFFASIYLGQLIVPMFLEPNKDECYTIDKFSIFLLRFVIIITLFLSIYSYKIIKMLDPLVAHLNS